MNDLLDTIRAEANVNLSDEAVIALGRIVAKYPVTAVRVAETFSEEEIKQIALAIKVVKDNSVDSTKLLKAYETLGKLVGLLPVG